MLATVARYTWRGARVLVARERPRAPHARAFATSAKKGNGENGTDADKEDKATEEEDDEFGLSGFDIELDDDEELEATLQKVADDSEEVTPELASELVSRLVESTTRSLSDTAPAKGDILPAISPHTISVLRASRISTNAVQAAASDKYVYPITKKVSAEINIADLNLSKPAEEALKRIAGPRVHDEVIKFSSNKYPSLAENQAHVVSSVDRLVSAAKVSVGEKVDVTPLENWEEVVEEVQKQAAKEIIEVGDVSRLLSEQRN